MRNPVTTVRKWLHCLLWKYGRYNCLLARKNRITGVVYILKHYYDWSDQWRYRDDPKNIFIPE
jgi:hypothetical protein